MYILFYGLPIKHHNTRSYQPFNHSTSKLKSMKKSKLPLTIVTLLIATIFTFPYCTQNDQVLDMNPENIANDTLFSSKVVTGPTINPIGGAAWDGTLDPAWDNAPKLTVTCTVPDLGNNTFTGFVGNTTEVTLQSLYDATDLYMLVEFNCSQKNVKSSPWYFDPGTIVGNRNPEFRC